MTDSPIPDRDDQTEQDRRERLERAFQARSASVELPEVFPHQELLYWLEIANMGVAGIRADELMRVYERYGSIEMLLTWSRGDLLELGARENLGLNFWTKSACNLSSKKERESMGRSCTTSSRLLVLAFIPSCTRIIRAV